MLFVSYEDFLKWQAIDASLERVPQLYDPVSLRPQVDSQVLEDEHLHHNGVAPMVAAVAALGLLLLEVAVAVAVVVGGDGDGDGDGSGAGDLEEAGGTQAEKNRSRVR